MNCSPGQCWTDYCAAAVRYFSFTHSGNGKVLSTVGKRVNLLGEITGKASGTLPFQYLLKRIDVHLGPQRIFAGHCADRLHARQGEENTDHHRSRGQLLFELGR